MVDTIVLRVHNLRKYRSLRKYINKEYSGSSKHRVNIPKSDVETFCKEEVNDETLAVDYFIRTGKHKKLLINSSKKILNSSGHYYLNIKELNIDDCIEFNFSVPKYEFGTNILMYVEHNWDKNFKFWQNKELNYNFMKSYDLLISFIGTFFSREFPDYKIDPKDIEINRIDLCFNQVFPSQSDALRFLGYQKKIKRKHSRKDNNRYREYDTSIMFITDRYSVKIYHKGSEYKKNDRKEHRRINKENGTDLFNIDRYQEIADKILRYEVTFRKSMLSYIFNHNIFRKKCPYHNIYYKSFKEVESIKAANERISNRIASMKYPAAKENYIKKHPYSKAKPEDIKKHKYINKEINKARKFMLDVDETVREYNSATPKGSVNYTENRAKFSKKLFIELSKFFLEFIKEFHVKEIPEMEQLKKYIDDYNRLHPESILNKKGMIKFYHYLQHRTFEEIKNLGIYSKATYYRYKKMFDLVGFKKNAVVPIEFTGAKTDLSAYHTMIELNNDLFRKRLIT